MLTKRRAAYTLRLTLLVLVFSTMPLWAQDALPLTQTITKESDTGEVLSLAFPDGWVTQPDSVTILVGSSEAAIQALGSGEPNPDNGIAVGVYLPDVLEQLNMSRTADAADAFEGYLQVANFEGEYQMLEGTTIPVAAGIVNILNQDEPKYFLAALQFPTGTVLVGAMPGDPIDPTALAILDSITFGDASAPTPMPQDTNGEASGMEQTAVFDVSQPNGDFQLTISLPAGWQTQYRDGATTIFIGNSENALSQASSSSAAFEAGEVAISIGLPAVLDAFGIEMDASPADAIQAFIDFTNASGKVNADNSFSVPATYSDVTGASIASSGDIYALGFEAGTVLVAVQPPDSLNDEIQAMLHSITFGEAETTAAGEEIRQWAVRASGSSEYSEERWNFEQATGEPNVTECADDDKAWASATSTGRDYLVVEFSEPVIPTQINIHQSYNPGSIVMIDVGNTTNPDRVMTLENSADAPGNTDCLGVFTYDVEGVDVPIDFVVIYVDQSIMGNWNEIDAVELVGTLPE